MQKIPLKMAAPGMTLAKPVENDRGMTLCGEGTEITEELIARLVRMEVPYVSVKGHPVKTHGEYKSVQEQLKDLDVRFRKVEADPVMKKIKSIFVDKITEGAEE